MNPTNEQREGLIVATVLETPIEIAINILRERFDKCGKRSLQIQKPGKTMAEWVPAGDVVEIMRVPRWNSILPLTPAERAEYKRLLKLWTSNNGRDAEKLTPEQIARFSHLSDRTSAEEV